MLPDLLPLLRRNREIEIGVINPAGNLGVLRFNFLHPPFDNAAVRRALLPAVEQRAFMDAAIGTDPALSVVPSGVFTPGTPLANAAGLEVLTSARSLEAARAALRASGYANQRVTMLGASDLPVLQNLSEVAGDGAMLDIRALHATAAAITTAGKDLKDAVTTVEGNLARQALLDDTRKFAGRLKQNSPGVRALRAKSVGPLGSPIAKGMSPRR